MIRRWEKGSRFYQVFVQRDLFGGLVVVKSWGSRFTRQGRTLSVPVSDDSEADQVIHEVEKTRLRHGYREVTGKIK